MLSNTQEKLGSKEHHPLGSTFLKSPQGNHIGEPLGILEQAGLGFMPPHLEASGGNSCWQGS